MEKDNITFIAYLQQKLIQKIVSLTPKIFNRKLEFCFQLCKFDEILTDLEMFCVSTLNWVLTAQITINRDNGTLNKRQIKTRFMLM